MVSNVATIKKIESSFLSCEKDFETILKKLFIENQPYSNELKRLLVINTKDCLDNEDNPEYKRIVKEMTVAKMRQKGYIKLEPKIRMSEHEDVKAYILITFDNFFPTSNPKFRDCTITIDVLCHTDYWDIGNFRMRPFKIMGYIDGILNNAKLSGIGTLQFQGAKELILDDTLSGYTMMYTATHGSDDVIPSE